MCESLSYCFMKVVDLFCGCGGFSEGARQSGSDVCIAVDNDADCVRVHKKNHPECNTLHLNLPCDIEEVDNMVNDGCHIHASPSCQKLSQANRVVQLNEANMAEDLVIWFADYVYKMQPHSWSFEQVATPRVRAIFDKYVIKNKNLFSYVVINCSDYGVPQDRRRLIAGSPEMIRELTLRATNIRCVLDVIPRPPSSHIKSTTTNTPDRKNGGHRPLLPSEHIRHVSRPCYTILASSAPWWSDHEGTSIRKLTARECSYIQTFPRGYDFLDCSNTMTQRMVGNAIPILLAKVICEVVVGIRKNRRN